MQTACARRPRRAAARSVCSHASGEFHGDVDVPAKVGFDLLFVVREEHVVEGQSSSPEVPLEALPDGHDLLVVGHGSQNQFGHGASGVVLAIFLP
jgi:hypothetical protein